MPKYKVVTIAIAVKNNRIAKHGETVDDSELTVNASELVEAGSIELIVEAAAEKAVAKEAKKAPSAAEKAVAETSDETVDEEVK